VHVQSITVRDAQEFPIADEAILSTIDPSPFTSLSRRRVSTLDDEFGAVSYDSIRPETILRDRRKLDAQIMTELLGLTDEEQRWVYRFAYAWWSRTSSVRHIANSIVYDLERQLRLRRLSTWYWPRIEQLPIGNRREIVLGSHADSVETNPTMFGWQVRIAIGGQDMVLDTTTDEEAEIISLFVRLGATALEIPSDAVLIAEVLPSLRTFVESIEQHLNAVLPSYPDDLRAEIRSAVASAICAR
jgi:hypothetical protein